MSVLRIKPDPSAPLGGVALLRMPAGALAGNVAHLQVQNAYTQLWLAPTSGEEILVHVGDGNWQADPHKFGPYEITRDGADVVIRIGPEIVNKLEVFAPLVLCIEGSDHNVIWPEDVPPRAGAALIGALKASSTTKSAVDETTRLVGRKAATEDTDNPASDPETNAGSEGPEDKGASSASNGEAASASRRRALIGALLGVVVVALAVAFTLLRPAEDTAEGPEEAPTVAEVAAEDPDCSFETLSNLPGGFAATTEALIASCDTVMDAETGFRLVERGTEAGYGEAWLALGGLYDPAHIVPVFEDRLNIAPGVNLPLAAEYYAAARAAGAAGATDRLMDVCTRLAGLTDTLSIGARNDFCP